MSLQTTFSNDSGAIDTISGEAVVITRPGVRKIHNLVVTNTSTNTGWIQFDGVNWILIPAAASGSYTLTLRDITVTADVKAKPAGGNPTIHVTIW